MTDDEIRKDLAARPTVPLWPHAGWVLNLGRAATYKAFAGGLIAGEKINGKIVAYSGPLRRRVGLDDKTS